MKILVTGGSGQLGSELIRQINDGQCSIGYISDFYKDIEIISPDVDELDLCDFDKVYEYIRQQMPDIVFHCAAYTNVDRCEEDNELCYSVNAEASGNLADVCQNIKAKILYISTDYVFSGENDKPYLETDLCDPINFYGYTKHKGEVNVQENCERSFIIRTSWLYGYNGKNFVRTIYDKAKEVSTLKVVNDQYGTPTNAEDLAYMLLKLAQTEEYGIYHCSGSGVCTWYDFAYEIIDYKDINCIINPCITSEYVTLAKRPAYSVLSNQKIEETLGIKMRSWQQALHEYLDFLE